VSLGAVAAQPEVLNGAAVVVNDAVITYQELERSLIEEQELLMRQFARKPQELEQRVAQLRRDRLEMMIERQVILHEYKAKGYNLPDSLFEKAIRDRIKDQFGDRVKMTKTLQSQGTTYETFAQQYREQIIVDLMTREFVSGEKILVSPFKIERFYQENQDKFKLEDQVKLRMIVLAKNGQSETGAARKLAGEIRAKIKDGASFAEMASVYSSGSQRAQGGDWGWVDKSVLREDLAEVAFKLKPGDVSDVIEKDDACFIMLVEEAKAAHVRALAEVRTDIEKTLKAQSFDRLRKQWLGRLRKQSFIQYLP
jgi:parvulin-like peptidyl-prolyl isomerase